MPLKYRKVFAHGDRLVYYRQKPNGVYEARYHREGIHIEVSSKDFEVLKQKFIEALNNLAATGNVKAKTRHAVLFNDFAKNWLDIKEKTTKPNTHKEYKRLFEHDIAPHFMGKTLADIDREFLQEFLFRYVEEGKNRTTIKRLFPNHHTHELRYTFITRAKESKIDPELVMLWDGHSFNKDVKTSVVDRGYTDFSEKYQLAEAQKFDYAL